MIIEVYTDGSATTADKPGGWGYVVVIDGQKKMECAGHMANATNNDAEMEAAIQGLASVLKMLTTDSFLVQAADSNFQVSLVSDSQLILGWASGEYSFKQINKIEKYHALKALVKRLKVQTRWVRGHNGDEHNERCDKLANEARLGVQNKKLREEQKERGETLIGTKKSGVICLWYKDSLKIVDLETNIVEDYKRDIHGSRGSILEIRGDKTR